MGTIIGIIIAVIVVIALGNFILQAILIAGAWLLFSPRANSVLQIIVLFVATRAILPHLSSISAVVMLVLAVLSVADCVRDIVLGPKFYDYEFDFTSYDWDWSLGSAITLSKFYVLKSILSLLTLGLVRAIYLVIVYPCCAAKASSVIKRRLRNGLPLYEGIVSRYPEHYYAARDLHRLANSGKIVGIADVVLEEIETHRGKYNDHAPRTFVDKVARFFNKNNADKKLQEGLSSKMADARRTMDIYIPAQGMQGIADAVCAHLENIAGPISPADMINWNELAPYGFAESIYGTKDWAEYAIIKALRPRVEDGTLEDDDISDQYDNHAYRSANSKAGYKKLSVPGL